MKSTVVPLPRWADLLSLSMSLNGMPAPEELAASWASKGDHPFWFSRSAWALAVLARWRQDCLGGAPPEVWLPDYFCEQSLGPLRRSGARLRFYPIGPGLSPDPDACRRLAALGKPALFIIVHYFGSPADMTFARSFCEETGAFLVEDGAHALRPADGIGLHGDFIFYSQHKLLPIPDGALLLLRGAGPRIRALGVERALASMRTTASSLGFESPSSQSWLLKRLVQSCAPDALLRLRLHSSPEGRPPASVPEGPAPSMAALRLLARSRTAIPEIARRRHLNAGILKACLGRTEDWLPISPDAAPYLAVLRCRDAEDRAILRERARRAGIAAEPWPDLPPEVLENPSEHQTALALRESFLTFPIHQTLSPDALLALAGPEPHEGDGCELVPADTRAWEEVLERCPRSNLLQSWAYGEAKTRAEGWTAERFLIRRRGENAGLVQVLRKQWFFGLLRLIRLNRGPLWPDPSAAKDTGAVLGLLEKRFVPGGFALFLVAPELADAPEHWLALRQAGFRPRRAEAWQSAWLDLGLDEGSLRKNLDKKWRNMVSFAERVPLALDVSQSREDFDWMLERHEELMSRKGFEGPSARLLKSLSEHAPPGDLLLFRALKDGESVAAILIARHGSACTYLLGHNGPKGRELKANNFLLWKAALEMKRRGCLRLDLGGMNDSRTPEIAKFKRGMGGASYRLLGEWFKISMPRIPMKNTER